MKTILDWFSLRCFHPTSKGVSLLMQAHLRSRVEEHAIRWFVLMRTDGRSDVWKQRETRRFKVWLNANLTHRKTYLEIENLWTLLGCFSEEQKKYDL